MVTTPPLEDDLITRLTLLFVIALSPLLAMAEMRVVVVEGLAGEPAYGEQFDQQITAIRTAAASMTSADNIHILRGDDATRDAVLQRIESASSGIGPNDWFALFLIGHGSYDDYEYKFNIPGPDIDGDAFAELLNAIPAERQLVVNATSASGAVLETWAGDNRLLVTATRSGGERNATRFGDYWAEAMSSDEADANKNGAITVQEAFEFAERKVADSYEGAGNLATEHPQLVGDTAGSFNVALLEARIATTAELEELIGELTVLEEQIEILRAQREEMENDVYLGQLQDLLLELEGLLIHRGAD